MIIAVCTLAIHSGALGDVILFGRLLERLGGRCTLVAGGEKARLLAGLGLAERAMDFDGLPMHEVFSDTPLEACRLAGVLGGFSRLVSCFGSGDRFAELRLLGLTGAEQAAFLPVRPPEGFGGHLLELWADLMGLAPAGQTATAWPVPPEWRQQGLSLLAAAGLDTSRPFQLLHPGSGGMHKCWPMERFLAVADALPAPAILLGPAELERWGGQIDRLRPGRAIITAPPLTALAGMLSACGVYVGNDSGVSHLSAAVGAATVAMFGPSRSEHFEPVGPRVAVLQAGSLEQLRPAEVISAIHQLAPV